MRLNILNRKKYRLQCQRKLQEIADLIDQELKILPGIVNVVFTDKKTIQLLNKTYRQRDYVTDILTFPYFKGKSKSQELLGEIFICVPQMKTQAKANSMPLEMELYTLSIHGLLHLRGFSHEKKAKDRVMKLLEEKILKNFVKKQEKMNNFLEL